MPNVTRAAVTASLSALAGLFLTATADAQGYGRNYAFVDPGQRYHTSIFDDLVPLSREPDSYRQAQQVAPQFRRQIVRYQTSEAPGTLIIDTPSTYLYYVLGNGQAMRYGIGVGRDGFRWSGVQSIARKAEWPDWTPPPEMVARQPYLPRFVAGGPGNPLGARAMYLGNSIYRIHGTNAPSSIGQRVSSGCIRMLDEDVIDLYNRTKLGAKVVVLPDRARTRSASRSQLY